MTNLRLPALIPLLLAAGCNLLDAPEDQQKGPVARLPQKICKQAREGVAKLGESGGFVYDGGGKGTIEQAAWLQLAPTARDQLVQMLAFDAACTAKVPPAEATATIRSETGQVLTERVVETSVDLSKILEE